MKTIIWAVLTLAVFLLQTQSAFFFSPLSFTVILVYFFGLDSIHKGPSRELYGIMPEFESAVFGAAVGLAEDVISGSIIGPGILSKGLIGFLTPLLFSNVIFRWTPAWSGVVIFLFSVLDGVILVGSRAVFTEISIQGIHALKSVAVQAVIGVPFAMMLKPKGLG